MLELASFTSLFLHTMSVFSQRLSSLTQLATYRQSHWETVLGASRSHQPGPFEEEELTQLSLKCHCCSRGQTRQLTVASHMSAWALERHRWAASTDFAAWRVWPSRDSSSPHRRRRTAFNELSCQSSRTTMTRAQATLQRRAWLWRDSSGPQPRMPPCSPTAGNIQMTQDEEERKATNKTTDRKLQLERDSWVRRPSLLLKKHQTHHICAFSKPAVPDGQRNNLDGTSWEKKSDKLPLWLWGFVCFQETLSGEAWLLWGHCYTNTEQRYETGKKNNSLQLTAEEGERSHTGVCGTMSDSTRVNWLAGGWTKTNICITAVLTHSLGVNLITIQHFENQTLWCHSCWENIDVGCYSCVHVLQGSLRTELMEGTTANIPCKKQQQQQQHFRLLYA